ncbi:MAG: carbohydrate ABC transporter permease, partial [Chloroflexota bacterium]
MESKTRNARISSLLSDGFLILYFLFALFPIIWMVLISLKSTDELFSTTFIFQPTLDNYRFILFGEEQIGAGVIAQQDFPRRFLKSLIVS